MPTLPRNYSRLLWVIVVNGLVMCLQLEGGEASATGVVMLTLSVGIVLELAESAIGALINVGAFLVVPALVA
jgi:hypothetical protein